MNSNVYLDNVASQEKLLLTIKENMKQDNFIHIFQ